ncbi:MAG: tol-pal system-associated acyl-CoA thioesterase [Alphaproteobacteria bacterium]|nr:tol-pal system-associated acyl-CoA thioesterase [Alphaproteobacteria bacterium]
MTPNPAGPQKIQARVYYEDTDSGGVVYYANYLRFAERGRTEFLRKLGFNHHQVREEHNSVLVVRHVDVDYLAPAKLDDLLDVSTEVIDCKNSSLMMKQTISRDGAALVEMKVQIVAVGMASGKAVRLPPQLRQIFDGYKAA